ncbi:MAG: winged helix-turn-helix transcriptional regulator [Methanobrevibacter sp.]|jgi:predicted transcriptional regulator|nr:winged helix-turn-helix transcriptional regulator [Candidatus Methanoflexus mossambicus]
MEQEKIDKLGFVRSSRYRNNILIYVGKDMRRPSEIAYSVDLSSKNVSRYLKELKDKKLIVCLNESAKLGRLYKLTDEGKEILECLEPITKK